MVILVWFGLLVPGLQAQEMQEASPPDTQRVHELLDRAGQAAEEGRYTEGATYLEEALSLSDSLSFDYGRAGVLLERGNMLLLRQNPDSARTVLETALRRFPDTRLRARLLNLLGTAYRYLRRDEEALEQYRIALEEVDTLRQQVFASRIRMNMASVYSNTGNHSRAFEYYLEGLEQAEASGDSVYYAIALNNVGESYVSHGDPEEAAYYLERSWNLSEELGYENGMLLSATNMGNAQSDRGNLEEAMTWYERALELHPRVRSGPPYLLQYNMGNLYGRMGELARSEELFMKSLDGSRRAGLPQGVYYNSIGLGTVASERGNREDAARWYQEALKAADSLDSAEFRRTAHNHLYELFKEEGDFESALNHLEQRSFWADSLNRIQQEEQLAEAETRLGLRRQEELNEVLQEAQAEQESRLRFQFWLIVAISFILILAVAAGIVIYRGSRQRERLNRQLLQQKEKLKSMNELKNKLLSIVAHDLRNPISALRGMLYLFREDELDRGELKQLSQDLEHALQQNLSTMENLLAWALSQMEGLTVRSEAVDLRSMTENLVRSHSYQAERKKIALEYRVGAKCEVNADPDMLSVVLRNLLSNAIKFSDEGDKVRLEADRRNGEIEIRISDSGIGIPQEGRDTLFSLESRHRQGTRNEKGSGLGLSLCKDFVEMQGGRISFESVEGEGTTFRVLFPAAGSA